MMMNGSRHLSLYLSPPSPGIRCILYLARQSAGSNLLWLFRRLRGGIMGSGLYCNCISHCWFFLLPDIVLVFVSYARGNGGNRATGSGQASFSRGNVLVNTLSFR
ncbi:hypothetical protein CORC01_13475 [Colletotrichum orchidophilum]|uniref:Uncharacterized protein n=1 Tax=Colletotrichum orchidophilum TaxID=1209926 RepID=A0A1G4AQ52_9PEZI|nr:uncharacterized protein CORC01_13475 [Colletotrichum orchidophilum]OHE91236.1 hypothetical protein CORC01_13475 [Colletotrichum orchidophilum]